jgi:hypothetical protein
MEERFAVNGERRGIAFVALQVLPELGYFLLR